MVDIRCDKRTVEIALSPNIPPTLMRSMLMADFERKVHRALEKKNSRLKNLPINDDPDVSEGDNDLLSKMPALEEYGEVRFQKHGCTGWCGSDNSMPHNMLTLLAGRGETFQSGQRSGCKEMRVDDDQGPRLLGSARIFETRRSRAIAELRIVARDHFQEVQKHPHRHPAQRRERQDGPHC